jgi:hypothetical protein
MDQEHFGYIFDIKQPTRNGYSACLAITPKKRDGSSDVNAKIERNLGRDMCLQIAYELLAKCDILEDTLSRVRVIASHSGEVDID